MSTMQPLTPTSPIFATPLAAAPVGAAPLTAAPLGTAPLTAAPVCSEPPPRDPNARFEQRLAWKFVEAERLAALSPPGRDAYRQLVAMRLRLARELRVPAYHVLTNRLLLELAEARPLDQAMLEKVPGFGKTRMRAYGAEVLAVLRNYVGAFLS